MKLDQIPNITLKNCQLATPELNHFQKWLGLTGRSLTGIPRHRLHLLTREPLMKIRNSLKSAKIRDKNCRVVRRHGRVYVINKKNPRMKARQG